MPTVHRYPTLPQVAVQPLPGVRTTPDAQGAGIGEALSGLGATIANPALKLYADQQAKARQDADERALTEFDGQLANWEHQNIYAPDTGVINTVKGKEAADLSNAMSQKFDEFSSNLVGTLTPDQQMAAQRLVNRRKQGIVAKLDDYGAKQSDAFDNEVADASLKTSVQIAIANAENPARVSEELQRQALIVSGYADRNGLAPVVRDQKLSELYSATHTGVIDQLLAVGKDQAAQAYFDATKDQISGDKRAQFERALEEGSIRGQAQQQADAIGAKATTLTEARDLVKAIQDPKLRDEVQSRVEHDWQVKETLDRQAREQTMIDAGNLIDKGGIHAIPPSTWVNFTPAEKSSLEAYAKRNQVAADPEGKTDLQTYYNLMTQASTDPEGFAKLNLMMSVSKLGKTEFKQLVELQGSIRKGDKAKADPQIEEFSTKAQVWSSLIDEFQIDPKDPAALKLRAELDKRVESAQQISGGKKLTNTEIRAVADDLMQTVVLQKGSWLGLVAPGVPFHDVTARKMDIAVPPADRATIIKALQDAGRPVTDDAVLTYYLRWKKKLGEIP